MLFKLVIYFNSAGDGYSLLLTGKKIPVIFILLRTIIPCNLIVKIKRGINVSYQKDATVKSKFKPQSTRLLDQVREVLRYHHYSVRTEQAYIMWILSFIRFHNKRHPQELAKPEIEAFLSDMAVNKNYAASTQSLAMNSIVS